MSKTNSIDCTSDFSYSKSLIEKAHLNIDSANKSIIKIGEKLTFYINFDIISFAHAQLVLSSTAVKASSVPGHWTKHNFLLRAEFPI